MLMTDPTPHLETWQQLDQLIEDEDRGALEAFYLQYTSGQMARAISRIDEAKQSLLLEMLDPEVAADLVEELPHSQAADIIEDMPAVNAAAIIDEMPSDEQADLLGELDDDDAKAILDHMDPLEAKDAARLIAYDPQTAGGLMISEYLSYPHDMLVEDVLADLRANGEEYGDYDVQFMYVTSRERGELMGVVRAKDLVLSPAKVPITSIRQDDLESVHDDASLDVLEEFFDRYDYYAAPVVDVQSRLVGVVRRAHVEEAHGDRAEESLMRVGGIITGEELRTMPAMERSLKRLAFLAPTLVLALMATSVTALFEGTIQKVPALAIFLPLVAGLCGGSGNQAMAVSMRELSLGLVTPADYMRVCTKELAVGLFLGVVLGIAVFGVVVVMRGKPYLGLAVGLAVPITMMVSVVIGGVAPLILKKCHVDPAMASGSIVTLVADLCGIYTVLMLAHAFIDKLT
jgi:magnesium transporter